MGICSSILFSPPQHSGLSIFGKVRSNLILCGRFPQATDKYRGHLREYRSDMDQSCPTTLLLLFLQALKWPAPHVRIFPKTVACLHNLAISCIPMGGVGNLQSLSKLGGVGTYNHHQTLGVGWSSSTILDFTCLSEKRQTRGQRELHKHHK